MKKVKTIEDIIKDKRIEQFIRNYDGKGKHYVCAADGWKFEQGFRSIEIGTVKEICDSINDDLEKIED